MQNSTSQLRAEQNTQTVAEIVQTMQEKLQGKKPQVGIVLGTGLGDLAKHVHKPVEIPYANLPNFPISTVASHAGSFVLGSFVQPHGNSVEVIIQQGRCHLYEGYSPAHVCTGIRVMAGLGIDTIIITNVSGALNPYYEAGDIMAICDHINVTGHSPLTGPNNDKWGERFPDMSQVYDKELLQLALDGARTLGIRLERGIYVGVLGPQLETSAETHFLRQMGGDAVGMSTVLEVIAAKHLGLRILGLSCLVNKNIPNCMDELSFDEVLHMAAITEKKLTNLIKYVVNTLGTA